MKLVNYKCDKCEKNKEELYNDTEEFPKKLEEKCECGGTFQLFNRKNNCHRWNFLDRGGL